MSKLATVRNGWKKASHSKTLHHAERVIHLCYYTAVLFNIEVVHQIAVLCLVFVLIPLVTDLDD